MYLNCWRPSRLFPGFYTIQHSNGTQAAKKSEWGSGCGSRTLTAARGKPQQGARGSCYRRWRLHGVRLLHMNLRLHRGHSRAGIQGTQTRHEKAEKAWRKHAPKTKTFAPADDERLTGSESTAHRGSTCRRLGTLDRSHSECQPVGRCAQSRSPMRTIIRKLPAAEARCCLCSILLR